MRDTSTSDARWRRTRKHGPGTRCNNKRTQESGIEPTRADTCCPLNSIIAAKGPATIERATSYLDAGAHGATALISSWAVLCCTCRSLRAKLKLGEDYSNVYLRSGRGSRDRSQVWRDGHVKRQPCVNNERGEQADRHCTLKLCFKGRRAVLGQPHARTACPRAERTQPYTHLILDQR